MYFPDRQARRKKAVALLLAVLAALSLVIYNHAGANASSTEHSVPMASVSTSYAPAVTADSNKAVTLAAAQSGSQPSVAYGKTNYPDLTDITYGTYRKLDYSQTYFYDFRTDWRAGVRNLECEYNGDAKIYTDLIDGYFGHFGIYAAADKNVVTLTTYSYLDSAVLYGVAVRTFDSLKSNDVEVNDDGTAQFSVKSLPNGPYKLCVWFDYTQSDGETINVSTWQTTYVSNGNTYFAECVSRASDASMEKWLAEKRNDLAADDVFQAWMAKNGGNDLDAALKLDGVTYPYYSNTNRYPNNVSKWTALAHEICPDENASDYTKARLLHNWIANNLVYDKRVAREKLPLRWAENDSGEYSVWNTHLGVCHDFANIYAIMCREMGVPCRLISDPSINHVYNAIYLNGRWELVDLVKSCDSKYVDDGKEAIQAFWDSWDGPGPAGQYGTGFLMPAKEVYQIRSYETDKYSTVENRIAVLNPKLDKSLSTKAWCQYMGGCYNH